MPVALETYGLFLVVMATLAVTPGPANLFAIATGIASGKRAALMAALGMNAATLIWFGAASLGLGALVAAFPLQFHWLAMAGAAYVAWLGLLALRDALTGAGGLLKTGDAGAGNAFFRGFGVQLANPKALLFFTAVLPPFIDPTRPAFGQLVAFAAGTLLLDLIAMSSYGFAGAGLAARMQSRRFRRAFNLLVGVLLTIAAVLIVTRG